VLPDVAPLGREFDYAVPPSLAGQVAVGTRVRVPLHGRRVGGWVTGVGLDPPEGVVLAPLAAVSGLGPPPPVIELARWAAWRWAGPVTSFLSAASPDRAVRSLPEPPPLPAPRAARLSATPSAARWPDVGALKEVLADQVRGQGPAAPILVRLPPADDLLAVVEAVLGRVRGSAPGGSVLVLVPSAGWAGRLAARLRRRGVPVAASWAEAAAGWPVVVGSRGAAWSPVPRLAAAVVLDAHDQAYRSPRAPTFDAWEVVAERAARERAPCVLTSPCPTVVQVARCQVLAAERTAERRGWPAVEVVDRRGADPRTGLFSEELVRVGRAVLEGGDRFVCVLNRSGRARLLACPSCGELARCERCGHPVALAGEELACRRCSAVRPVVCASCGATRLRVLRAGTAQVREELEALLRVPVAEVAGPKARPAGTVPGAPVRHGAGEPRALVGTEAVLHRVAQAGAVAFLDFDQHLLAPRLGAGEEALALLARAARLVGPRDGGARPGGRRPPGIVVQTRLPDHPVLDAAVRGDPGRFVEREAALRHELALPPESALALLSGPGAADLAAHVVAAGQAAGQAAGRTGSAPGGRVSELAASGLAASGLAASELGEGRWLLRAPDHRRLCDALGAAPRARGRVRVEVDPTSV